MDMNNNDSLKSFEICVRTGWKDEEKLLLWEQVRAAQRIGAPLKQVFETVAARTGRKPNSVRNYYYMKVKETGEIEKKPITFVPFSKEEVYMLLRELLCAGARGESIRGASLRIAGGDKTLMLRYQNKYRSLIKTGRSLVERVMADMDSEAIRYVNPYLKKKTAAAREGVFSDGIAQALKTCGIDAKGFLTGLKKMASLAAANNRHELELREVQMKNADLEKQNDNLKSRAAELSVKLEKQIEKNNNAANLLRQLLNMSTAKEIGEYSGLAEWLKETSASAEAL